MKMDRTCDDSDELQIDADKSMQWRRPVYHVSGVQVGESKSCNEVRLFIAGDNDGSGYCTVVQ